MTQLKGYFVINIFSVAVVAKQCLSKNLNQCVKANGCFGISCAALVGRMQAHQRASMRQGQTHYWPY